ncbi:hypothetical protein BATDEDRAFT_17142 [Batrachochytrium dendrobatidis JAM81]|uniref:SAM-dependent MTase RsmB/NOP-type domain-containing protein n=1 Tax=Batrachochytrium dendrobatidis (strain JAM81 / FGSC 10211) TaxID=684364 RepID=F4P773_BATDJ|nr:uncharacterized protein BATDEDRAFT_17142 [Batrachochytrium dendrobatidis JAM81]EGF79033.1 hypothetical protein BATDEDRAFT_17142 [Batrachochytrium dendrobatidis JAM81]|eukprot:XP_006680269.1 hypothetical protein BATDEDRAFT_17142 [Batrachochytrium dendrobatidis JAM81]
MHYYEKASNILTKLYKKQGTIKGLVMKEDPKDKKLVYGIVCETLKYREVIEEIICSSDIRKSEPKKLAKPLLTVLVYDLLFGKGIKNAGKYKDMLMRHKSRLNAELVKIKVKRKCKNNQDLIPEHIRNAIVLPRYVRINTIKTNMEQVISHFEKKGYRLDTIEKLNEPEYPAMCMIKDQHLPELLLLPPSTDLHEDKLLLQGHIVLQDKASCFPAYILSPPKGSVCIDACAAPGNKTSHLSAILGNTGTIYAFDKDRARLDTLQRLTHQAGCKNILPQFGSFLDADPFDPMFSKARNAMFVEYVLLDPSCSGSGIVGRLDHLLKNSKDAKADTQQEEIDDRANALADFQKKVILHAFKFPKVKRIVYSTCSRNRIENEDVVQYCLQENTNFSLVENVFPQWHRRGLEGSIENGM